MAKQADTPEQAVAAPKKNKMKLIVVAAVALIAVIVLSVGGTWYLLGSSEPTAAAPVYEKNTRQQAVYELLEPAFVVNFKSEGRPRYLQVSVALMGRDKADLDALKVHMPTLRNQLVMLFSSQEFEELNTSLGVELLKQKATVAVQELALIEVGKPVVEQVLFTNIVMQ